MSVTVQIIDNNSSSYDYFQPSHLYVNQCVDVEFIIGVQLDVIHVEVVADGCPLLNMYPKPLCSYLPEGLLAYT